MRVFGTMLIAAACAGAFAVASCASSNGSGGAAGGNDGSGSGKAAGSGGDGSGTPAPVVSDNSVPTAGPAQVEPDPNGPKDDGGGTLGWPTAPVMSDVQVIPNRDSAVIVVPDVAGAADYRAMIVPAGVSVEATADGKETVKGSTIVCAGYRQHNAKFTQRELLRQIEMVGITGPTRIVVEAIDSACPFTGVMAQTHQDVSVSGNGGEVPAQDAVPFSVWTEQEIVAKYGSMIFNGHGKGSVLGAPADPVAPKVLARTTIKITPTGTAPRTDMTFFDDFQNEQAPKLVSGNVSNPRAQAGKFWQNDKWDFYSFGGVVQQMFFDRGRAMFVAADIGQDVMASNMMIPRKPVAISDKDYVHVTFEVSSDATERRYWWVFLCGADQLGKTFDASGALTSPVVQSPFFMSSDGQNPSIAGWNCVQTFVRDGWPFALPPNDKSPESEFHVTLNKPVTTRDTVVSPDPNFYANDTGAKAPLAWYRQRDANNNPTAPILDDQLLVAPRTKFDMYVRRDRLVLYVNGEMRACNDFGANPLTMAEAALGFGQVLYHTTAERSEFFVDYWNRTGQRYYIENTPYVDERSYDNVGYAEHVVPPNLDESLCYKP